MYIKLTFVHCQPFHSCLNVSRMYGYYIVTCRGNYSVREESWGLWVHEDQGSDTRACRAIPGVSISGGHIGRDKIVAKVGKRFYCKIAIFHKIVYIKLTSMHCRPFRSSRNVSKMYGYYIVTCRGNCSVREESWGIWVHEDQGSDTRACRVIPGVSISGGHIGRDKIVDKVGKRFYCKNKDFPQSSVQKLTSVHCQPFRSSLNVSKMCGYYIVTCRGNCSVREESWGIWVHEDEGSDTWAWRAIPGVSISWGHIGLDKIVAKVGKWFIVIPGICANTVHHATNARWPPTPGSPRPLHRCTHSMYLRRHERR